MVLDTPAGAEATRAGSLLEARNAAPRTDVQVRNYDDRSYTLELVARDDDDVVFERRYWLSEGEFRAERAALHTVGHKRGHRLVSVQGSSRRLVPEHRRVRSRTCVRQYQSGTYEVTATVTIGKRDVATCRVGTDPYTDTY